MNVPLGENEHIEILNGRLRLIVSPAHTFGTDAMLLAAFAMPKPREKAADLGAGCGIIPFYWLSRGAKTAVGVELQPAAANQMRRAAALSGLGGAFTVIEADVRDVSAMPPPGSFDVVSMNPPYTRDGHGIPSAAEPDRIARHERTLTLAEAAASAARLLRFGGRFCLCLRPERLTEAMLTLREADLEPKRLRFVSQTAGKAPWLFLLEGKKGRRPGLTVEPELHVKTPAGGDSPEMREILGEYAARKD